MVDTVVCEEGAVLTPEQCKILELFDQMQAVFKIKVLAMYHDGECVEYPAGGDEDMKAVDDEDDEEMEEVEKPKIAKKNGPSRKAVRKARGMTKTKGSKKKSQK